MSIYNPGGILDKEPVAIKAVVIAIAGAVIITWPDVNLSGEAVAAWGIALELLLGLFVRSKSTPNVTADLRVEAVAAETEVRVKTEVDEYLTAAAEEKPAPDMDEFLAEMRAMVAPRAPAKKAAAAAKKRQ